MIGFVISTLGHERQDFHNGWFAPQWRKIDPANHMLVQFLLFFIQKLHCSKIKHAGFDLYKNKHTSQSMIGFPLSSHLTGQSLENNLPKASEGCRMDFFVSSLIRH